MGDARGDCQVGGRAVRIAERLRDDYVRAMIALIAVGQVGDVVTTSIALGRGFHEANPLFSHFLGVGIAGTSVKLSVVIALVLIDLALMGTLMLARFALGIIAFVSLFAMFNNFLTIVLK